jgi:FkbM family methyltransferase
MADVPYLTVVVTTRNDDHGGDPLRRFQAFLNCFSSQCARFALDCELVVVEWNPPGDRPRLTDVVQWPAAGRCTVRVIEVPAQVHAEFRHADALPLFQMIAKNVGIRRARGEFVLATNMDIVCSDELVEFLAAKRLRRDRLYRADRFDVQAGFPADGCPKELLAYCQQHLIRSHLSHGSFPVRPDGALALFQDDIVEPDCGVHLGDGWHVRERHTTGEPYRWVGPEAELLIDSDCAANRSLSLTVEANPYAPAQNLVVAVCDAKGQTLAHADLTGGGIVDVDVSADAITDRLWLFTSESAPARSSALPIFERRADLRYRVRRIRWSNGNGRYAALAGTGVDLRDDASRLEQLPMGGWLPAISWPRGRAFEGLPVAAADGVRLDIRADGLHARTLARPWAYCLRYPEMIASAEGSYEFCLVYELVEGQITFGALNDQRTAWIPHIESRQKIGSSEHCRLSLVLNAGQRFTLIVANGPSGQVTGASRFVVRELRIHTAAPRCSISVQPSEDRKPGHFARVIERVMTGLVLSAPAQRLFHRSLRHLQARWDDEVCDRDMDIQAGWASQVLERDTLLRDRWDAEIRHRDAIQDSLLAENRSLRQRLRSLEEVERVLEEFRAPALHGNGCGDFQLMARDRWLALRGYPELEMFSMNIDALFSYIAVQAGVTEVRLPRPLCLFHLEHEHGSGWSPEGEAQLRRRIAERGVPWLDWADVAVCAAYMRRFEKPMLFNDEEWGLANVRLPERRTGTCMDDECHDSDAPADALPTGETEDVRTPTYAAQIQRGSRRPLGAHPIFQTFVPYSGDAAPGFERWYYGVNVRDWLFTGTSNERRELRMVQGFAPPVNDEYFDWIALLTTVCAARERFCVAELGAGWGRWIVAAAHVCRQRGIDFRLIGVEAERTHFDWMQMVFRDNDIDPSDHHLVRAAVWKEDGETLLAGQANPLVEYGCRAIGEQQRGDFEFVPGNAIHRVPAISLNTLLSGHDVVDLMLLDVQGAEHEVLVPAIDILRKKVKVVHIGTHSNDIERGLTALFRSRAWLKAFAFPGQTTVKTEFGEVAFGDGIQTWVNPEWPELCRALTNCEP